MKAVIYDLDGTLLDTLADIAEACNHVLLRNGLPAHPVDAYRKMVGNGFETLIKRASAGNGLSAEFLAKLTGEAREFYASHLFQHTSPYKGIPQILAELQNRACLQAVFSNKPDQLSKELISHYFPEINFKEVTGAKSGQPLKPDPAILLKMLTEFDIEPKEALYVGDSNVDILTAQNAHITAIGVAWGFRGEKELLDAKPDVIVHTPQEILQLV